MRKSVAHCNRGLLAFVLLLVASSPARAESPFRLDVEAGAAWQTRNSFAVPGDSGTRVDLDEAARTFASRITLTWDFGESWSLRAVAAPLVTDSDFVAATAVDFDGTSFAAGERLRQRYEFNSYRLSFVRNFASPGPWSFRLGFTGKVRDASIRLSSRDASAVRDDLGFVPLLYGGARYDAGGRLAFDAELDGLAAPQGRAVDLALRLELRASERLRPYVGYRVLEGGADNDEVLTFATFHYALAGVSIRF